MATSEISVVDELDTGLEGARLAVVSLLAVITEEQLRSVETALEALGPMSDAARLALVEIRSQRHHRRVSGGQDEETREAIEAHLATRDEARRRAR